MIKMHFNGRQKIYLLWLTMLVAGLFVTGTVFILLRHHNNKQVVVLGHDYAAVDNLYQNWSTFPGASQSEHGGVYFSALDLKIVNQDGSGGQGDPAVNVGGPHMMTKNGFGIEVGMSELDHGEATFRLYGEVPVIYDEWRSEGASFSVTVSGQDIITKFWNGSDEAFSSTHTYKSVVEGNSTVLTFERGGNNLIVSVNGKRITSEPTAELFNNGNIWFGAAATGDGWTLTSLRVGSGASLKQSLASTASVGDNSLGVMAARARVDLRTGAAISLYPLMTDQAYRDLALNEFTQWTPENEMKAQFIHPAKDTYTFQAADLLVDTALKNNISVHGHALVFGEANALWMQQTSKTELKDVMTSHITTVMTHFKGKVAEWDVVNEPLDDYEGNPDGLRRSIWYNALGRGFIAEAFKAAHAADPAAKLYINEYGLEENGERWTTFLNLIKELKAANVPIDGVGFQSHVYDPGDEIDVVVLRSHMQQLAAVGVVARISEMDVHGDDASLQASQYGSVAGACRAEPTCTSFSTWGISDKYGSTTSIRTYPPEFGDDLLWDSNFKPKNALQNVLIAFK